MHTGPRRYCTPGACVVMFFITKTEGERGMQAKDGLKIYSASDLSRLVQEYGFLPLFKNQIPGFSVEEHTPPELWFADGVEGPWEWKGPVIRETGCAYG